MKKVTLSLVILSFSNLLVLADAPQVIDLSTPHKESTQGKQKLRLPVKKEMDLNKLISYANEIANDYLQPLGKSLKTLSSKLRKKVNDAINNTYLFFEDKANYMGKKSVDKDIFKEEIIVQLKSLISSSSEVINKLNLKLKIDECIGSLCQANSIDHKEIPNSMTPELTARKEVITKQSQKLLISNKKGFVSSQDIYTIVHDNLAGFVERVQYALLWKWINAELKAISRKSKTLTTRTSHIPYSKKSSELREKSRLIRLKKVTY